MLSPLLTRKTRCGVEDTAQQAQAVGGYICVQQSSPSWLKLVGIGDERETKDGRCHLDGVLIGLLLAAYWKFFS